MGKGNPEGYPAPPPLRTWLLSPSADSEEHRHTPPCACSRHTRPLFQHHKHHPSSGTKTWGGGGGAGR